MPSRCSVASAVLALALGPGAAGAHAGGPGVTIFTPDSAQPVTLSGDEISAAADVAPTQYTVRSTPYAAGTTLTLGGLSVRGLIARAGANPDAVRYVTVIRDDGSLLALTHSDFADPPPFPEGPALVSDDGGATRLLRPVRGRGDANAKDNIVTTGANPLQVFVGGGSLLVVKASASPARPAAGAPVRLRARVAFAPPGASLTYHWSFGDGTTATGAEVTHTYATPRAYQAQVAVRGRGGSGETCAQVCGGVATVDVVVGDAPSEPQAPDPSPGTGTGNPQAPGAAGGSGGSGDGDGDGAGDAASSAPTAPPPPPPRPPTVDPKLPTVTGILLAGMPRTISKLPSAGTPVSQDPGAHATRGGSANGDAIRAGVAGAFALFLLGALRERGAVRLRP